MDTTAPTYVTIAALAARWGVSADKARQRTRSAGFPSPLVLGPRTKRWPLEEVERWEQQDRSESAATWRATKTQPGLRVDTGRQMAVRRTVTPRRAA